MQRSEKVVSTGNTAPSQNRRMRPAGKTCLCSCSPLSAPLEALSDCGCIYTICTRLSPPLAQGLDTHWWVTPTPWAVTSGDQTATSSFQGQGSHKTRRNAFGQQKLQKSICGRKFSPTDALFAGDASAVTRSGV